jgi:hypothetical protein
MDPQAAIYEIYQDLIAALSAWEAAGRPENEVFTGTLVTETVSCNQTYLFITDVSVCG